MGVDKVELMDKFVFLPNTMENNLSVEKVILHWVLSDEAVVNKGDVIMEMITKPDNNYPVIAHRSGILIRFWDEDLIVEKTKYEPKEFDITDISKVCIAGIFNSYEDYINSFFKYKAKVSVDSFTKEKAISWVYVAEPISFFPFITGKCYSGFRHLQLSRNDLNRRDIGEGILAYRKFISISFSKGLSFSYVFSEGKSFIEFSYSQDIIKLKKNDIISFLFENGNIIDFKLINSPYRKNGNSKTKCFRCQLYAEDVGYLTSSMVSKWKITFAEGQKPPICEDIVPAKDNIKIPFSLLSGHYTTTIHLIYI